MSSGSGMQAANISIPVGNTPTNIRAAGNQATSATAGTPIGGATAAAAGAGTTVAAATVGGAGANGVVGAAMGAATALMALVPATLTYLGDISTPTGIALSAASAAATRPVPFDFNPTKITMSRTATFKTYPSAGPGLGLPAGSGGAVVWKSDPPDIAINEIIFEGLTTKLRCDTLINWMEPMGSSGFAGEAASVMSEAGMPVESQTPTLLFMWGPPLVGMFYFVQLLSTTIAYERFMSTGIPIRAKVNLKFKQTVSKLSTLPTNPTSGGLPGRHTHTVRSGETLQSIAYSYYKRPGAWRRIADINGISDPARVRPGTTIFLPAAGELEPAVV